MPPGGMTTGRPSSVDCALKIIGVQHPIGSSMTVDGICRPTRCGDRGGIVASDSQSLVGRVRRDRRQLGSSMANVPEDCKSPLRACDAAGASSRVSDERPVCPANPHRYPGVQCQIRSRVD